MTETEKEIIDRVVKEQRELYPYTAKIVDKIVNIGNIIPESIRDTSLKIPEVLVFCIETPIQNLVSFISYGSTLYKSWYRI